MTRESGRTGTQAATVLAHHGSRSVVETASGKILECTLPRSLRPVCGDRVRVRELPDGGGHLESIEPRVNEFPRVDARGRRRMIAANLDRVLVVLAPTPAPTRYIVDRYLVATHAVELDAALVANKADHPDHRRLLQRLAPYAELGYPVIATSAKTGAGLAQLRRYLKRTTGILVGQSGVGKSRLAACLLPGVEVVSAELSRATGKGRHTTTSTRLFHLPDGGRLVDSPGVWEYGLWRMPRDQIERGFVEFRPYLDHCRFRDCSHVAEPGCAVVKAVEDGAVSRARYDAYRQILGEKEYTS